MNSDWVTDSLDDVEALLVELTPLLALAYPRSS